MRSKRNKILIALLILIIALFAYRKNKIINKPTVLKTAYLHIPTGANYNDLIDIFRQEQFVDDIEQLEDYFQKKNFNSSNIRAGRFKIEKNWTKYELIEHLKKGKQAPVNLVLNYQRLRNDVAGKAARFIEADSTSILSILSDRSFLEEQGYNYETALCPIIPNTYEFFWNTSAKGFYKRMLKENDRFWAKENRLQKAKALGLSTNEVYTLASIVEKETNKNDEKERLAGVYINRINTNMPLQADPTLVFALKDFSLRRILNHHKKIDSKYNTYKYKGLPPGPIALASIPSIDAVLNAEKHNYYYFCAKADGSGYHAFAKNLDGHNQNADRYHKYLDSIGR